MVFLSSFLALLVAFIMAFVLIIVGAFRWIIGLFRSRTNPDAQADRVVVVGFDGMDPRVTDRLMDQGKLPNFQRLADEGTYERLNSTCPPISPIAWSTFATGTNPGKHNIFDFLRRKPLTYEEDLSSTDIQGESRSLNIGRFSVPLRQPTVELLQKSKPFWHVLGENGVFTAAIRVPITYPAQKFNGVSLSGMCVPDVLGTQGTFAYYTTDTDEIASYESGLAVELERQGDTYTAEIAGPANPLVPDETMTVALELTLEENGGARLTVDGKTIELQKEEYTDWVPVTFKAGLWFNVDGICRFYLIDTEPEVRLYQTPVNIDPGNPSVPLAHPLIFSNYLAKSIGPFSTLGIAEDSWGVNEGILSDDGYVGQCHLFHEERKRILFDVLDTVGEGMVAFVFDLTDRMQHMFLGRSVEGPDASHDIPPEIEQTYGRADATLGEIIDRLGDDDVLLILSDHGFARFHRCVDLNRWLADEGYLALNEDSTPDDHWSRRIDWSRTRAYAFGLSGIYLNLKGREGQGIVEPGDEAETLKSEMARRLKNLEDPASGKSAVVDVFDADKVYRGPYTRNAPDLILGFRRGFRVSWESAVGDIADEAFFDNERAWSADHGMAPSEVPGVFFSNRKMEAEHFWIGDLAPTVLQLFGIEKPAYMDGRAHTVSERAPADIDRNQAAH